MTTFSSNDKVLNGPWLPVTVAKLACLTLAVSCCGCVTISVPPLPFLNSVEAQHSAECSHCGQAQDHTLCNCTEEIKSNVVVSHSQTVSETVDHSAGLMAQAVASSRTATPELIQTGPVSTTPVGEWGPTLQPISLSYSDHTAPQPVPPVAEGCGSKDVEDSAVRQIETQMSELTLRMHQLEQQSIQDQLTIKRLRESQTSDEYDRTQLLEEVSQWKKSVRDLRSSMRLQQQHDIDSLTAISRTLARLAPESSETQKGSADAPQP